MPANLKCVFIGGDFQVQLSNKTSSDSVIGYANVGLMRKTLLPTDNFTEYFPKIADSGVKIIKKNQTEYRFLLTDTTGVAKNPNLLKSVCHDTDIFFILFSVKKKSTFDGVAELNKALKEICFSAKCFLIGITDDFFDEDLEQCIADKVIGKQEAVRCMQEIAAIGYHECSINEPSQIEIIYQKVIFKLFLSEKMPNFFKKNLSVEFSADKNCNANLSSYLNNSIEIIKWQTHTDSIFSRLPNEIIFLILFEAGKKYINEDSLSTLIGFFLSCNKYHKKNEPLKFDVKLFAYKRIDPEPTHTKRNSIRELVKNAILPRPK